MNEAPNFDAEDAEPYVPSDEEIACMRAAPVSEGLAVDALILRECTNRLQKVAKIIGTLIPEFNQQYPHLPIAYMQARMQELEDRGKIEITGDVWAMRYSEVRLVVPGVAAA